MPILRDRKEMWGNGEKQADGTTNEEGFLMSPGFLYGMMKMFIIDCGAGYTTLEYTKSLVLYTLNC